MSNRSPDEDFYSTQENYRKKQEAGSEGAKLSVFFSLVSAAVLNLDARGQLLAANEKARRWLGLVGKEGQVVSIPVFDEERRNFELIEILKSGQVDFFRDREFYLRNLSSNEEMTVRVRAARLDSARLVRLEGEAEFLIVIEDVTAEKELAKLKDDLINIMSDQLRTPLTSVIDNLWLIDKGRGGELSEKTKGYLSKAIKGTERMIALIGDILNASSLEQGRLDLKVEALNLKDLVLEEMEELKGRAEQRGLVLEVGDFANLPAVYGDKRRILEVLANFIGNSLKYTEKGSVKVTGQAEGSFVKISVIDSGKGFSAEDKIKLFMKFGRLDNSLVTAAEASGTGLGLYISKMLVEKMSGQIGGESAGIGKGSTFWFTLPIAGSWKQ